VGYCDESTAMKILLVNMPWAATDVPSLALGILKRAVAEQVPGAEVEVLYANLDYVDWCTDVSLEEYSFFALHSFADGYGDWVFSSALYDDPEWRVAQFAGERRELCRRLHKTAPEFVEALAERIVGLAPDVVGFSCTFQQNTAALAAAKHVKRRDPRIVTVLGGASCDGPQGEALHRNFPFVDFVQRGEGEAAFPELLRALADGADLGGISGLCWRDAEGVSRANAMSANPLPPDRIVAPEYDDYFARLPSSRARSWSDPKLLVEGSRGCWWGEKHHCTFCGLNGSFMQFRSKSPHRFLDEIVRLAERHQVLDLLVVDNILDMNYLRSLLPALAALDYDFRFFYEIKANLRADQVRTLADAGIVQVQAGIENLSSHVLGLMEKGATGCQNVRLMRDAESSGVLVEWNYLYGFPGETDEDYESVIDQMPALHHLSPPHSAGRFLVERFSPYFTRPELGFADLRPAAQYAQTYDLPESELFDLAYVFDVPPRGIGGETALRLAVAVQEWVLAHHGSRLTHADVGDHILLVNRRPGFDWKTHVLAEPLEREAFRLLDRPHAFGALTGKLGAAPRRVEELLERWLGLGLLFADGGQFVHVAPSAANQELRRVHLGRGRERG
jgi:ribosomal peptide maturation radical SAM protein 1